MRGDWVQCTSCGEESIFVWRDPADFVCSVCGGNAVIEFSYTQGLPPFRAFGIVDDNDICRKHKI
jgi:hypothetical protein